MGWISVEDKLPEIGQKVLIYGKNVVWINKNECEIEPYYEVVTLHQYSKCNELYWENSEGGGYTHSVIAWMPIPKYEEGGSDDSRNNQ